MDRAPCCEKVGLKKGPWTLEEDQKLVAYVEVHGHGSWRAVPEKAGLQRCGKSCRLRWTNYLRPDIQRGKLSLQEEQTIIQLHALLGNRWSAIATHLPKRTDNEIKNYWNTHLKKKLANTGIDPVTHKPKSGTLSSGNGQTKIVASLAHMAQWESARLEAEARLARESKLRAPSNSVPFQTENQLGSPLPLPLLQTKSSTPPPPPFLDVLQACQGLWPKPASGNMGANIHLELPTSSLSPSQDMSIGLNDNSEIPMPTLKTMNAMILDGKAPCIKSWSSEGSGFTDMLLSNSDEQNSLDRVGDTENGEGDSFLEWDNNEEESKNYWNSLLDFVSLSEPSNLELLPGGKH